MLFIFYKNIQSLGLNKITLSVALIWREKKNTLTHITLSFAFLKKIQRIY